MSKERALFGEVSMPDADYSVVDAQIVISGLTGYINAGGRGTRLASIFEPDAKTGVSKALLPIGRPPISLIEHHINKLTHSRVPTIIAGVGDHASVAEHVKATYGHRDDIHSISYATQLGNGGDLVRAIRDNPDLFSDDILITNVDTLLDIEEGAFLVFHRAKSADLSIAVTLNSGVPNQDAYHVGSNGEVVYCAETDRNSISIEEASPKTAYRASSTGALIANKQLFLDISWEPSDGPLSLYKEVVGTAVDKGTMYAYNNGNRLFTDVGTVSAWNEAQANHELIAPHIYRERR